MPCQETQHSAIGQHFITHKQHNHTCGARGRGREVLRGSPARYRRNTVPLSLRALLPRIQVPAPKPQRPANGPQMLTINSASYTAAPRAARQAWQSASTIKLSSRKSCRINVQLLTRLTGWLQPTSTTLPLFFSLFFFLARSRLWESA